METTIRDLRGEWLRLQAQRAAMCSAWMRGNVDVVALGNTKDITLKQNAIIREARTNGETWIETR